MSWQKNAGVITWATGPGNSADMNNMQSGLTTDIETYVRRFNPWPGVIKGMAPSINGAEVEIAAGIGTVKGNLTLGTNAAPTTPAEYPLEIDLAYDFTAEADDDWWIYLDGAVAAEASALSITSDPANLDIYEHLLLAKVTWATPTLSALVDLRWWGTDFAPLTYYHADALVASTMTARWEIGEDCALRGPALVSLQNAGSGAGPTVIKLSAGTPGAVAELWSTAGDRFSIAHDSVDGAQVVGVHFDQNMVLNAGDCVEVETIGVATGAAGLSVMIPRFNYNVVA